MSSWTDSQHKSSNGEASHRYYTYHRYSIYHHKNIQSKVTEKLKDPVTLMFNGALIQLQLKSLKRRNLLIHASYKKFIEVYFIRAPLSQKNLPCALHKLHLIYNKLVRGVQLCSKSLTV
jgi:hypothetical protein